MSVTYNTSSVLGVEPRVGQKRSLPPSNDNFEDYHLQSKRAPFYTYFTEGTSETTSPRTPESGIDMNDIGCSPPCYSVTRTSYSHLFESGAVNTTADMPTMHLQPGQSKDGFYLIIVDEPEENYRARYDSEGCRGPMKGRNGGCPTVEIRSSQLQWTSAEIKVELVAADKSPLNSCKLDSTDEGANLLKKTHQGERVSFENLRIRRLKKGDATSRGAALKPHSKQTLKGTRSKQDEKVAYLLFTAHVKPAFSSEVVELKVLSQAIYLNASHDPPEIHCVVPQFATNGDPVAIIGTRMHSPRVTFIVHVDGKEQEIPAEINKEVSHQNALVIKVPHLPMSAYCSNVANVQICVTAGKGDRTGKEPLKSNPVHFCCVLSGVCKECVMTHQQIHRPLSQPQPFNVFRRLPTPSPPPKSAILPQPRQSMPSKSVSPRPHHPGSPGYASPPPSGGTMPMTSSCSSSYGSFPVNPYLPVCQSSPQITIQSSVVDCAPQQQSGDHIDLLSSFCSPADNCSVTPSRSPQASPSFCSTVVHSEPMIDSMGFPDNHPGPVSPDEFNCYLPNNSQVVTGSFGAVTSCCSRQQDYTNVYSGNATAIGVVQPSSLGQFTQNP